MAEIQCLEIITVEKLPVGRLIMLATFILPIANSSEFYTYRSVNNKQKDSNLLLYTEVNMKPVTFSVSDPVKCKHYYSRIW